MHRFRFTYGEPWGTGVWTHFPVLFRGERLGIASVSRDSGEWCGMTQREWDSNYVGVAQFGKSRREVAVQILYRYGLEQQ